MSKHPHIEYDERAAPTVRSLSMLLVLCGACGLFVAVAFAVVAAPAEQPPVPVAAAATALPLADQRAAASD